MTIVKLQSIFCDLLKITRIFWTLLRVQQGLTDVTRIKKFPIDRYCLKVNQTHCPSAYKMFAFSSCLRNATDIYRFPIVHMVKTHFLLENLSISEPSLGILQNFQCRSALPNIKYNCAVLFLRQVNYLFNYAPKTKNSTEKKISHRLQC